MKIALGDMNDETYEISFAQGIDEDGDPAVVIEVGEEQIMVPYHELAKVVETLKTWGLE